MAELADSGATRKVGYNDETVKEIPINDLEQSRLGPNSNRAVDQSGSYGQVLEVSKALLGHRCARARTANDR